MDYKKVKINLNSTDRIKKFIQTTRRFMSDIDIMTDRACIDAKSVLGIYALDLSKDVYVRIISNDVSECRKFYAEMEEFR